MSLKSFANGKIFAELNLSSTTNKHPLIVFLHGWGRSRNDFANFINDRNCVAFDLPGFGSSLELETLHGASDYAKDISEALDELPSYALINGVVLVGHSLGGRVSACLAAMRPDLVRAVLFVGTPLIRYQSDVKPSFKFKLAKTLNKLGLISDKKMEKRRKQSGSADYRNASGLLRESLVKIINESYQDELTGINCPVSFLWGELDTAAPVRTAYDSQMLVKNSKGIKVIEGASHDVHLEKPDELRFVLNALLKDL